MSIKKVVIAPHESLRTPAAIIDEANPAVQKYVQNLQDTITSQQEPAAAGLALPQIDTRYQAFATYLESSQSSKPQVRIFINPQIIDRSDKLVTGPNPRQPDLEGCLSIPKLYGPVKRPEWVTFEYQQLIDDQLSDLQQETFYDFAGRVMQHEYDHLHGVLFTDYTLEQGLPLYQIGKGNRMQEVDPIIAQAL